MIRRLALALSLSFFATPVFAQGYFISDPPPTVHNGCPNYNSDGCTNVQVTGEYGNIYPNDHRLYCVDTVSQSFNSGKSHGDYSADGQGILYSMRNGGEWYGSYFLYGFPYINDSGDPIACSGTPASVFSSFGAMPQHYDSLAEIPREPPGTDRCKKGDKRLAEIPEGALQKNEVYIAKNGACWGMVDSLSDCTGAIDHPSMGSTNDSTKWHLCAIRVVEDVDAVPAPPDYTDWALFFRAMFPTDPVKPSYDPGEVASMLDVFALDAQERSALEAEKSAQGLVAALESIKTQIAPSGENLQASVVPSEAQKSTQDYFHPGNHCAGGKYCGDFDRDWAKTLFDKLKAWNWGKTPAKDTPEKELEVIDPNTNKPTTIKNTTNITNVVLPPGVTPGQGGTTPAPTSPTTNPTTGTETRPEDGAPSVPDSFYTPTYADGIGSVWDKHKDGYKQTDVGQFFDQFKVDFGAAPSGDMCFSLDLNFGGHAGNWGVQEVCLPDYILQIVKTLLIVLTLVYCRKLIMGG